MLLNRFSREAGVLAIYVEFYHLSMMATNTMFKKHCVDQANYSRVWPLMEREPKALHPTAPPNMVRWKSTAEARGLLGGLTVQPRSSGSSERLCPLGPNPL